MKLFDEYGREIFLYNTTDAGYDHYSETWYYSYVKITEEMVDTAKLEYEKYVNHLDDCRKNVMDKYELVTIKPKIGKKERAKLEAENNEIFKTRCDLLNNIPRPIDYDKFIVEFFDLKHTEAEYEL